MVITNSIFYLLSIGLCVVAYLAARGEDTPKPRAPRFWLGCSLLLVACLVNKQLDLQLLITNAGRDAFLRLGAYGHRRAFQWGALLALSGGTIAVAWRLARTLQSIPKPWWLAVLGLCQLLGLILVRAVSLHYTDIVLGTQLLPYVKGYGLLELFSLLLVAWAACRALLRPTPSASLKS